MEIRLILAIIYRRKWIILQSFILVLCAAVLGCYLLKPQYESSARLLVESSDTASSLLEGIGLSSISSMLPSMSSDSTMENNLSLLTVAPVVNRVIFLLQLRKKDGELRQTTELLHANAIISALFPKPYISVRALKNTDIIEIKARASDVAVAVMLADTFAELFIQESLKWRKQEYKSARIFIEEQIRLARKDFSDALKEFEAYQIKEKTINIETETKIALEKMAALLKEKEDNIIDIAEDRATLARVKAQLEMQDEENVSSGAINENPQIERLKKDLMDLEYALIAALEEKTSEHIDVIILKKKIKTAKNALRIEIELRKDFSGDVQKLEKDIAALEVRLQIVNRDIKYYTDSLYTLPAKALAETQLKLKISVSQELYKSLLEYLYQVGIAEVMTISDVRLIESAAESFSDEPVFPKKVLAILVGIFLGLVSGLGLAFLLDYFDDTFKTPDDVKKYTPFSLLATILKSNENDPLFFTNRDPKDPLSEAYRTLRNSVQFMSLDNPVRTLLVTSSLQGEGKSTIACNYAISLASEDRNVLIIDLDLRRPAVHKKLALSNKVGVSNVLSGRMTLQEAVQTTKIEGLDVMSTGPTPPDPGKMIESGKMGGLIKMSTEQYDFVVIDSPPILVGHDPIVLARYTDASLMVMESGKVTRRAILRVQEILSNSGVHIIGVVLNKVSKGKLGEHYYYYYSSDVADDERK